MVEIHLSVDEAQVSFLSVPLSDVRRLAIRPFKWLRFVMFCISGARGDLSDGSLVNYDTEIASFADAAYYYKPYDDFIFVDPDCLNESPMTSTANTAHRQNFRTDVMRRDGDFCVFTAELSADCEAAHLIPKSKGDEYAQKVVQDRAPRYGHSPITGINDIRNALLVSKSLHSKLSNGTVALVKTPGFGLLATDIRRLSRGSTDTDRITLQQLVEPFCFNEANLQLLTISPLPFGPLAYLATGANLDALISGTGDSPPSTIILDFMYGVAAYNFWGIQQLDGVVEQYHNSHYQPMIRQLPSKPRRDDDDHGEWEDDADYKPDASQGDSTGDSRMAKAIDKMNLVLMYLKGISPTDAANLREKRMEEEEQMAQEASRTKVMEWRQTVDII